MGPDHFPGHRVGFALIYDGGDLVRVGVFLSGRDAE
jgi:hypothetical protein